MHYDFIIVGGGAAGLAAAIYGSRRALKTLVITESLGGQAATTEEIENYPGVGLTGGPTLTQSFKEQAERFGATFVFERAERLAATTLKDGQLGYTVTTDRGTYTGRTLLIATGLSHRHLNVPGERQLTGKGVSYCATCDAPLFKDQPVAVIGGGNSALDSALLLAKYSPSVTLIHRGPRFSGEATVLDRAKRASNIQRIVEAVVTEIQGKERVTGIKLASVTDPARTRDLAVAGVFVEIGYEVHPELFADFVETDAKQQIVVSPTGETSRPGVFAAGDITTVPFKQIVISAGAGAKAALQAHHYLLRQGVFTEEIPTDWGIIDKN